MYQSSIEAINRKGTISNMSKRTEKIFETRIYIQNKVAIQTHEEAVHGS